MFYPFLLTTLSGLATLLGTLPIFFNIKNKNFKIKSTWPTNASYPYLLQSLAKDIANDENVDRYYILRPDDFVYNPRISVTAPCGPINMNETGKIGVISPLYTVFSIKGSSVEKLYLKQLIKKV